MKVKINRKNCLIVIADTDFERSVLEKLVDDTTSAAKGGGKPLFFYSSGQLTVGYEDLPSRPVEEQFHIAICGDCKTSTFLCKCCTKCAQCCSCPCFNGSSS